MSELKDGPVKAEVEQRRARSVAELEAAARQRVKAAAHLEQMTGQVRQAVLQARHAGVSVRRAAEIGQVSPDTVNRWTHEARGVALAQASHAAAQLTDPAFRGTALAERYTDQRPGTGQVRMFAEAPVDRGLILRAAYTCVLETDPALAPDPDAAHHAAQAALEAARATPVTATTNEVIAALDLSVINRLLEPLDRAAARLMDSPINDWQRALAPHVLHLPGRNDFRGATGARETLDAALLDVFADHGALPLGSAARAVGGWDDYGWTAPEILGENADQARAALWGPDGITVVIAGARWDASGPPTAYKVHTSGTPAIATVTADRLTPC